MSGHKLCYVIFLLFYISVSAQQPIISVTPDSISEVLFTGQISQRVLNISNSGTGNLSFDISVDFPLLQQNYALQFDGIDDIITINNSPSLCPQTQLTIEAWVNLEADHPDPWTTMLRKEPSYSMEIGDAGNNRPAFGTSFALINGPEIPKFQWHHWAGTYDGQRMALYIDGEEVSYVNVTNTILTSSSELLIGMYLNEWFRGVLDEVRIWNVGRTQLEIQNYMHQELTGSESGLVGYWQFNEGAGNTVFDLSLNGNNGLLLGNVTWVNSTAPINPDWLTLEPDSGIITGGASQDVPLLIDAFSLEGGSYNANIIISSNDPVTPQITIPLSLQVTSAPDIVTSADTLDFGGHFVGATDDKSFLISNRGFDPLIITDIISSHLDYTVTPTNFTLNPYENQEITVTFVPGSVGNLSGNLTIQSNDPDEPSYTVLLFGEGLIPPSISVSPNSLSENLLSGKTSVHTLTINNSGGSDLNFDIRIGNVQGARRFLRQIVANEWQEKQPEDIVPEEIQRQSLKDYCPAGNVSSMQNNNQRNESFVSSKLLNAFDLRILLITSQDYPTEIQGYLQSFPDVSVVDIFDAYSAIPTLSNLLIYDAVIVMNNPPFGNPVELGNILADYADAGGGVILAAASFVSGWEVQGRLLNEGYIPFNIGTGPAGSSSLGNFNVNHPIMYGVTTATGDLLSDVTVASGAELVAEWFNGLPFVATRGNNVAAVNIYVTNSGYWTGDIPTILHNAVCWSSGAGWLAAEPSSGTVSANSSMDIEITFNAAGMNGGSYSADIIIANNDPVKPEVTVPAQLTVTDAPAISVENDTLDFGEVFLGVSDTLTLVVENKGSMDLLIFSATIQPGEYSIYPPFAGIDPGETEEFMVTFLSQVVGNYPGTLNFASNDPKLGNYRVVLSAQGVEPPVIMVTPSSLYQILGPGQSANQVMSISNVGASNLKFKLTSGATAGMHQQNYALQFDGIDDIITINNSTSLCPQTQLTIEAWVNLEADHPGGEATMLRKDGCYLMEIGDSGNNRPAFLIWWSDLSNTRIDGPEIPKFQWHHWAGTYDGQIMALYIDGQEVSYVNVTKTLSTYGSELLIGMYWYEWFLGVMDEVRIWNLARTQLEIQNYMHQELTGSESGLVGYWQFNEGTGNTVFDLTSNDNDGLLSGDVTWVNSTAPITPTWLSVAPDSGICLPASLSDIMVTFDAAELDTGEYDANIYINSNDPILSQVTVPVHLSVSNTVGIEADKQIPKEFKLSQNYPNPFNPTTTIKFDLPKTSKVSLKVFNILGEEVVTLVSYRLSAGSYSYEWDATNLASGVYLYRLQAGDYVETRKMVLMR
jgi:hypothetical protein